jgi:pimeloyl-ACP methyl ester carboxylesterase
VGHSRGAYLVARLTLEHPELFKTCILVDTNTEEWVDTMMRVAALPKYQRT